MATVFVTNRVREKLERDAENVLTWQKGVIYVKDGEIGGACSTYGRDRKMCDRITWTEETTWKIKAKMGR